MSEPPLPIEVYTFCQNLSLEEYGKNWLISPTIFCQPLEFSSFTIESLRRLEIRAEKYRLKLTTLEGSEARQAVPPGIVYRVNPVLIH